MKKLSYLLIALAALLCVAVAQDSPWFDIKNCSFCKQLTAEPGLLDHMKYEYHNIDGGFMSVTMVDKEYQEAYLKAMSAMEKVGEEMKVSGKMVPMCQFCTKFGEFMMKGTKTQVIHSALGDIFMMTSPDTAIVTELQAFATRTSQELAKLNTETKAE
jgi:hypothetical protein